VTITIMGGNSIEEIAGNQARLESRPHWDMIRPLMELRGQRILLVGASSGIGRALALELAKAGAKLHLVARRGPLLEAVAQQIRAAGGEVRTFAADTSDPAQVRAAWEALGPPDGLLYNAGVSHSTMLARFSSDDVRRLFETNFHGFLYWMDHFLPILRRRRFGWVGATTALCAYRGIPSGIAYSASKGAIGNFLEGLRMDLEPYGIRVFQLMPGFVNTPMAELNNITSPLAISPEEAARFVREQFEKERTHIEFPGGMSWAMKLLRNFPDSWYSALFRKRWILPRHHLERLIEILPPLRCRRDGTALGFDRYASWVCPRCGARETLVRDHLDLLDGRDEFEARDRQIEFAYRFYSMVYPVVALWAMACVWKGSLRHLLRFYRDRVREASPPFLDVATGDGSLTKLVLRKVGTPDFVGVDLSQDMLEKASKKLRSYPGKLLYICDIGKANWPDGSFSDILCFGGLHVFSDLRGALANMRRLLRPGGRLSGSYLLRPQRPWADRLAEWAIEKGLLSNCMTEEEIARVFEEAGFRFRFRERNGRMLLFALERRGTI